MKGKTVFMIVIAVSAAAWFMKADMGRASSTPDAAAVTVNPEHRAAPQAAEAVSEGIISYLRFDLKKYPYFQLAVKGRRHLIMYVNPDKTEVTKDGIPLQTSHLEVNDAVKVHYMTEGKRNIVQWVEVQDPVEIEGSEISVNDPMGVHI